MTKEMRNYTIPKTEAEEMNNWFCYGGAKENANSIGLPEGMVLTDDSLPLSGSARIKRVFGYRSSRIMVFLNNSVPVVEHIDITSESEEDMRGAISAVEKLLGTPDLNKFQTNK